MSKITLTSDITVRAIQQVGGDAMVCAAAKVSTTGEAAAAMTNAEANAGLINYLMAQRHGSVFEHASLTFFVHAPIFVFREWMRHRIGFSFNEESGRYKLLDPVFWAPRADRPMLPVEGYKAARPKFVAAPAHIAASVRSDLRHVYTAAYIAYEIMVHDYGIAGEVARACLPVGIYSSAWVSCNPRSLMAFLSLRTHEPEARFVSYPQAEIEEAARTCETILAAGWPLTYAAFVKNGRVGP